MCPPFNENWVFSEHKSLQPIIVNFVYVVKIDILMQAVQDSFVDFRKVKPLLDIFSIPSNTSPESALELMHLEW